MASSDTAKPATARHGEPASKSDRFAGEINKHNKPTLIEIQDIQARRLTRLFAISYATAATVQHGVDPDTIKHSVNGPIAVALDHFTKIEVAP
jgi:hypothetical protein